MANEADAWNGCIEPARWTRRVCGTAQRTGSADHCREPHAALAFHPRPRTVAAAAWQGHRSRVWLPRPDGSIQARAGQLVLDLGDAGCGLDADQGTQGLRLVHAGRARKSSGTVDRATDRP